MKTLGIVTGPNVAVDTVLDPILDRLDERGSVGIVREGRIDTDRTVYEVDDGLWTAQGTGLGPEGALGKLAETHDYAILVGFPNSDVPIVAVGDTSVEQPAVAATEPSGLELDAVDTAIEDGDTVETLESLIAEVKDSPKSELSGAIATFTGQVRAKEGPEDEPTESLTFERYDAVAEERMAQIESELTDWDGVYEVAMHHRVGRIERGENIVFVVVLAGHREEAFEAVEAGINRLKDEVPIFKKETTVREEFWRHDREPGAHNASK